MGVDGHIKRGKYVSSHEHLNVTYLMEVDENEVTRIKEDENSGVRWINVDEIKDAVTEKWVLEKIYNKEVKHESINNWCIFRNRKRYSKDL